IGEHARDQYTTKPTEWPNFTKSDVLYCPAIKLITKDLPPILIEVQHTANMSFFRRLMKYSLSIRDQCSVLPIVIAICTYRTSTELLDLSRESEINTYMKQLPCEGWAQCFYLLNGKTISGHLQQIPLDPLVALAHFFIEQQPSLIHMKRQDDETIRLLYSIEKRVFESEKFLDQDKDAALKEVCSQAYTQLNMAKQTLIEDVQDKTSRK
ncbi:hypothetical protein BDA99DRAFT_424881, partial [Phascolomyces articulosus]